MASSGETVQNNSIVQQRGRLAEYNPHARLDYLADVFARDEKKQLTAGRLFTDPMPGTEAFPQLLRDVAKKIALRLIDKLLETAHTNEAEGHLGRDAYEVDPDVLELFKDSAPKLSLSPQGLVLQLTLFDLMYKEIYDINGNYNERFCPKDSEGKLQNLLIKMGYSPTDVFLDHIKQGVTLIGEFISCSQQELMPGELIPGMTAETFGNSMLIIWVNNYINMEEARKFYEERHPAAINQQHSVVGASSSVIPALPLQADPRSLCEIEARSNQRWAHVMKGIDLSQLENQASLPQKQDPRSLDKKSSKRQAWVIDSSRYKLWSQPAQQSGASPAEAYGFKLNK